MFANRKIDNFFNKKKRSTLDHSQKKGKEHLILSESSFSKQTLTKIGIEKQLLNFDLDSQYGPAYGITRMERYERAQKLGLNPPKEISELIKMGSNDALWAKHFC